ncbi:hypothetical protein Ngar_c26710 [Candidatus Nitrososphaera gargensis Ga9.2]|uniref:Uncharacterized protein n=1 Tax=Nitrososphaera gargensis (strain Ga9.2) TaxID=1237085 RepID=K0ILP6_NITGG|nr:hypothetical protein [Candidatus Nitrososphaera gargensis]AFU59592.1 hypothetical protein Ngar_c26710 [Candidatus Nitrososphaera gargensis Ga9.2]
MVVIIELVSMIIGNPATGAGSAAGMNPIDTVELVAIVIASIIFVYFAIIISLVSYRRRKEIEARAAEWRKGEEERRRRLREVLSELGSG